MLKLSVIGLGKLGLPLLALLAKSGYEVIGYDKNVDLRAKLAAKEYNFQEPELDDILNANSTNIHIVDSIEEAVTKSVVVFVIVPTPSDSTMRFSNGYILEVLDEFSNALGQKTEYCILNIVSTVMPNSCVKEFIPRIENKSGKKVSVHFGLTYNPEFIALGSVIKNMEYPDMHLIGSSDLSSGEVVEKILRRMSKNAAQSMIMNLTEAEIVKISVNNFVTMKISFANMLMQLANKFENVNVDTITNAIGMDTRVGKKYLRAGTPYGGPCFPRDTRAMGALFNEHSLSDALPKTVGTMNDAHTNFLAEEVVLFARDNNLRKIGLIGLSYKENSYVVDESPSIFLAKHLNKSNFEVLAWDPMIDFIPENGRRDILVLDTIEDLLRDSEFVVLTRTISSKDLELIVNFEGPLKVYDPWGQISFDKNSLHQIFQPGRSLSR